MIDPKIPPGRQLRPKAVHVAAYPAIAIEVVASVAHATISATTDFLGSWQPHVLGPHDIFNAFIQSSTFLLYCCTFTPHFILRFLYPLKSRFHLLLHSTLPFYIHPTFHSPLLYPLE
jgi:hypothetical protein